MKTRWYDQTPESLAEQFNTDLSTGLSKKEAASRLKSYGKNEIFPVSKRPFKNYLLHIVTDFMALLYIISAALDAIVTGDKMPLVGIAVILLNYLVTIFAYVKSHRVLEEMGHISLPSAKVMRGGKLYLIKQERLVRGDVILVSAGDIVPCDARLISSEGLTVLESGLFQTDKPSQKDENEMEHRKVSPSDRTNMIYASTIVTAGKGRAVVCDTGEDTLVCMLGKNRVINDHDKLKVSETIRKFCSSANLLMILFVFLITGISLLTSAGDRSAFEVYMTSLSLSVSDMTELAIAFTYIVIACGVFSALKRNKEINAGALIKNSSRIDKIKELNCLIVPKESLFSERDMTLSKMYVNGKLVDIREGSGGDHERCLRYALISTGIYGMQKLVSNNDSGENIYTPEQDAIIHAAERSGLYDRTLDRDYPILDHTAAGNGSLFETTLVLHGSAYLAILRGGAESVLQHCDRYLENGRVFEMDYDSRSRLIAEATHLMRGNNRILAVASKRHPYNSLVRIGQAQSDLIFEGFLCIEEPMIPGAAKYISQCKAAGMRIILFCKDVAENNKAMAISMGIAKDSSECTTLAEISKMKEDLIRANISIYSMYEGLNNNQQRYIINWLKADYGCKIGVLGRDLDDLILLNEAEVGFSEIVTISGKASGGSVDLTVKDLPVQMKNAKNGGKGGCEALKFVSDVIVSNPDSSGNGGFNSMITAITSSRMIYRNLLTMMRYLLYSQGGRLWLVVGALLFSLPTLLPRQILFLGLIVDVLAVLVIAFSKPDRSILGEKDRAEEAIGHLRSLCLMMIGISLLWPILILTAPFVFAAFGIVLSPEQTISYGFVCCILTQFLSLAAFRMLRRKNKPEIRIGTASLCSILFLTAFVVTAFFVPSFGALFGIVRFPPICWVGILLTALLSVLMIYFYLHVLDKDR